MADKTHLDLEKELELLNQELKENEKIYEQVKSHYDSLMNIKNPNMLKVVVDQTSNVLKVRSDRLSIIKEMINAKKVGAEMALKEKAANKDENDSNENIKKMAKEVYNLMKNDNKEGAINNILNKNKEDVKDEEAVEKAKIVQQSNDDALDDRMREIQAKKEKERKEQEFSERGFIYVCDKDKNIYAINQDGELLLDEIDIPDFQIEFFDDELTGMTRARNQYGDIIEIVEFEEDDEVEI